MTSEDIKKLVSMIQTMPEGHKLLKNLLLDYFSLKKTNEKLIETNLRLVDDVRIYENLCREELEIVIH